MRQIATIESDIERCKTQIASTYNNDNALNEDALIVREGFQQQLQNLENELEQAKYIRSIRVVDPRTVPPNECEFLGV